uniref:Uncharacterized protein n=1 Tax=Sipha flava TaxID=143950 RepID=A0A2S2PYW3_9HEMI
MCTLRCTMYSKYFRFARHVCGNNARSNRCRTRMTTMTAIIVMLMIVRRRYCYLFFSQPNRSWKKKSRTIARYHICTRTHAHKRDHTSTLFRWSVDNGRGMR